VVIKRESEISRKEKKRKRRSVGIIRKLVRRLVPGYESEEPSSLSSSSSSPALKLKQSESVWSGLNRVLGG
jgi:hypothetical protein